MMQITKKDKDIEYVCMGIFGTDVLWPQMAKYICI